MNKNILIVLAVAALGCDPKSGMEEPEPQTTTGMSTTSGVGDVSSSSTSVESSSESGLDATGSSSSSGPEPSSSSSSTSEGVDSSSSGGEPPEPLESLSDDFSGDLSEWEIHLPKHASTLEIVDDQLVLVPQVDTAWFNNSESVQLFKGVDNRDFMVTTELSVFSPTMVAYQQVGLFIRGASEADSYSVQLGTVEEELVFQVGWQNTNNGATTWNVVVAPSETVSLRLCRFGSTVRSYYLNTEDDSWVTLHTNNRPDLEGDVFVGPGGYALNEDVGDIEGRFESVDFEEIASLEECEL